MKKKNNKQIPAYAFGALASAFGSSLVQGVGSQAAKGLIDMIGPFRNGLKYISNPDVSSGAKALSFTGVGSALARKQAEQARKRREASERATAYGMQNTALMDNEYWQDNDLASTYAFGGVVPNDLAYLDNNEVIRDDYGNIAQVPNTRPGTDNHLVDASNLESVLSDKIKRPGTNRTYAKEAKILAKMSKPSKGKDRFAENTNKLNKINANDAYNNLLVEQELVKASKGIKQKTKKFALGMVKGRTPQSDINSLNSTIQDKSKGIIDADRESMFQGGFDFGDILGSLGSLAPTMYNAIQSGRSAKRESPMTNPYTGAALRTLNRRRNSIDPILTANSRSRAINNYNLANYNANTGANLAARNQSAVNEYVKNAEAYFGMQNANNAYLGDFANTAAGLGSQYMQDVARANDINDRNLAAREQFGATAATQFGQWSQVMQRNRNLRRKDRMVYPLLEDFLAQGYTSDKIDNLRNTYYGG